VEIQYLVPWARLNGQSAERIKSVLRDSTEACGWTVTMKSFISVLNEVFGSQWLMTNRILVDIIDASELIGFDGDMSSIFMNVGDNHDFTESIDKARSLLINEVKSQIEIGGSTLFFDIDIMQSKSSVILIPQLINQRAKEYLSIYRNYQTDRIIDVFSIGWACPMWRTSYGLELLMASASTKRNSETKQNIRKICDELCNLLTKIYDTKSDPAPKSTPKLSQRLTHLMDSLWLWLQHRQRFALMNLFESGFLNTFKFVKDLKEPPNYFLEDNGTIASTVIDALGYMESEYVTNLREDLLNSVFSLKDKLKDSLVDLRFDWRMYPADYYRMEEKKLDSKLDVIDTIISKLA